MSTDQYKTLRKFHITEGELAYGLEVFGDELAKREGYKEHSGMDAIHFYLVHKFSWPLWQVRSMSAEDIRFILAEEMHGWTLPKAARFKATE